MTRRRAHTLLTPGENDWQTFGRTPLRSSAVASRIEPPLTPAWEYDLAAGTANGSPLVMDSLIFVGTMRGELHAVRLADGKRVGWVSLGEAVHGTVATDGSTIFVPLADSRESVVAFDLAEGRTRWQQSCGDGSRHGDRPLALHAPRQHEAQRDSFLPPGMAIAGRVRGG